MINSIRAAVEPTVLEFALMARDIYEPDCKLEDWERIEVCIDEACGLALGMYRKRNTGFPIVFAVRGSANFRNFLTGVNLTVGITPDIFGPGMAFVTKMIKERSIPQRHISKCVYITGHSLGALVAEMIAVKREDILRKPLPHFKAITFESPGSKLWLNGVAENILMRFITTYQVDRYICGRELVSHPKSYDYINTAFPQSGNVKAICTEIGGAMNQINMLQSEVVTNLAETLKMGSFSPKLLAKLLLIKEVHGMDNIVNALKSVVADIQDRTQNWPHLTPDDVLDDLHTVCGCALTKEELCQTLVSNQHTLTDRGVPAFVQALLKANKETTLKSKHVCAPHVNLTIPGQTSVPVADVSSRLVQDVKDKRVPHAPVPCFEQFFQKNIITKYVAKNVLSHLVDIETSDLRESLFPQGLHDDDISIDGMVSQCGLRSEVINGTEETKTCVSAGLDIFMISDFGIEYKRQANHENIYHRQALVLNVLLTEKCRLRRRPENMSFVPAFSHYVRSCFVVKGYQIIATGYNMHCNASTTHDVSSGVTKFASKLHSRFVHERTHNMQDEKLRIQIAGIGGYIPPKLFLSDKNIFNEIDEIHKDFVSHVAHCAGVAKFSSSDYALCWEHGIFADLQTVVNSLDEIVDRAFFQKVHFRKRIHDIRQEIVNASRSICGSDVESNNDCSSGSLVAKFFQKSYDLACEIDRAKLVLVGEVYAIRFPKSNGKRLLSSVTCQWVATETSNFTLCASLSNTEKGKFYLKVDDGRYVRVEKSDDHRSRLALSDIPTAFDLVPDSTNAGIYYLACGNEALGSENSATGGALLVSIHSLDKAQIEITTTTISAIKEKIVALSPVELVMEARNGKEGDMAQAMLQTIEQNVKSFKFSDDSLNDVRKFFEHIVPKLLLAKDLSLVYVIGSMGSGKSTLINKLVGHDLKYNTRGNNVRELVAERRSAADVAPMGDKVISGVTTVATIYKTVDGLCLCDTPGFGEERDSLNGYALSYTQAVSKETKAIIMVIDFAAFLVDRAKPVEKTLDTLCNIIPEVCIDEVRENILFVLNMKGAWQCKPPGVSMVEMLETHEEENKKSSEYIERLRSSSNDFSEAEAELKLEKIRRTQRILKVLHLLVHSNRSNDNYGKLRENVIVWQKYDDNISAAIIKKLRSMKSCISKQNVRFENVSQHQFLSKLVAWKEYVKCELKPSCEYNGNINKRIRELTAETIEDLKQLPSKWKLELDDLIKTPSSSTDETTKGVDYWLMPMKYGDLILQPVESKITDFFFRWFRETITADLDIPGRPLVVKVEAKEEVKFNERYRPLTITGSLKLIDKSVVETRKPYAKYQQNWDAWMASIAGVKVGVVEGYRLHYKPYSNNVADTVVALKTLLENVLTTFDTHVDFFGHLLSRTCIDEVYHSIHKLKTRCDDMLSDVNHYVHAESEQLDNDFFLVRKSKLALIYHQMHAFRQHLQHLEDTLQLKLSDDRVYKTAAALLPRTKEGALTEKTSLETQRMAIRHHLAKRRLYFKTIYDQVQTLRYALTKSSNETSTEFDDILMMLNNLYRFSWKSIDHGWNLKEFSHTSDSFYHALIDQLRDSTQTFETIKQRLSSIVSTDAPILPNQLADIAELLNVVIAVVDKSCSLRNGFSAYFVEFGEHQVALDPDMVPRDKYIVRLAEINGIYFSVHNHPVLLSGALRDSWCKPAIDSNMSTSLPSFNLRSELPGLIHRLYGQGASLGTQFLGSIWSVKR